MFLEIFVFSEERGLQLIIESVGADSPAFRSGAREGDVIVAVDDWLITPMDRPQVSEEYKSPVNSSDRGL